MRKECSEYTPLPKVKQMMEWSVQSIYEQEMRVVRCPYCRKHTNAVFQDSRGFVRAKCKLCGHETLFNILHPAWFHKSYDE